MSRRFFGQAKSFFECSGKTGGKTPGQSWERLAPGRSRRSFTRLYKQCSASTSCRGGCTAEKEYEFTREAARALPDRIWLRLRGTWLLAIRGFEPWRNSFGAIPMLRYHTGLWAG